jgi:hypothetical protein
MKVKPSSMAAGIAIIVVGLAATAVTTHAQSTAPSQSNAPTPGGMVLYQRMGPGPIGVGDTMDFVGFEAGLGGKTVTGAPFAATMTVRRTQVLADGNEINRTTTGTIARDSEGRVRRDMTLPAIGAWATTSDSAPHVIIINDVIKGTQYILEPDRKIAQQVPLIRRRERLRMEGNSAAFPGDSNVNTTSLGTQTIDGVQAQGTRYTRTIPAGQIGNEKPIVITTERWYSPDLQMYVLTKTTDPVRGNSVRQLTNIQMGEPDPSLFQVPPDYTVRKGHVVRIRRRARAGARGALPVPPPPDDGPELAPPPQN